MLIIRSLSTTVAASGLPLERGCSSVVGRVRSGCGESERVEQSDSYSKNLINNYSIKYILFKKITH
jgi:hypothetical protein